MKILTATHIETVGRNAVIVYYPYDFGSCSEFRELYYNNSLICKFDYNIGKIHKLNIDFKNADKGKIKALKYFIDNATTINFKNLKKNTEFYL